MSTTISPNMNLPVPNVVLDAGPDWATNLNACLSIIDQHNHTAGSGVPISVDALNIADDLTFQGNSATNVKSVVFTPQTSLATLDALYVSGVDLYFNDGSGSPAIRMTSGGNVNATSSGISSGTATASFVGGVLVVNAAATTPANVRGASFLFGNNTPGSNFLTLSPPNAMAASYGLTLPTIPVSTKIMALDASGNMSAPYSVDATSIEISTNVIQVKDLGITTAKINNLAVTTAKIATANVTRAKLVTPNRVFAATSTGSFSVTNTGGYTNITNASVDITCDGLRPVWVGLLPSPSAVADCGLYITAGSSSTPNSCVATVKMIRAVTDIAFFNLLNSHAVSAGTSMTMSMHVPPGVIWFVDDAPTVGVQTYKLQVSTGTTTTFEAIECKLFAWEMPA